MGYTHSFHTLRNRYVFDLNSNHSQPLLQLQKRLRMVRVKVKNIAVSESVKRMSVSHKKINLTRRQLLSGVAATAGGVVSAPLVASESNPENLPPNVSEWTPYLGAGVDANPYGMPSEHEAHVIRRNVEWLTASTESSVNFTP